MNGIYTITLRSSDLRQAQLYIKYTLPKYSHYVSILLDLIDLLYLVKRFTLVSTGNYNEFASKKASTGINIHLCAPTSGVISGEAARKD